MRSIFADFCQGFVQINHFIQIQKARNYIIDTYENEGKFKFLFYFALEPKNFSFRKKVDKFAIV